MRTNTTRSARSCAAQTAQTSVDNTSRPAPAKACRPRSRRARPMRPFSNPDLRCATPGHDVLLNSSTYSIPPSTSCRCPPPTSHSTSDNLNRQAGNRHYCSPGLLAWTPLTLGPRQLFFLLGLLLLLFLDIPVCPPTCLPTKVGFQGPRLAGGIPPDHTRPFLRLVSPCRVSGPSRALDPRTSCPLLVLPVIGARPRHGSIVLVSYCDGFNLCALALQDTAGGHDSATGDAQWQHGLSASNNCE